MESFVLNPRKQRKAKRRKKGYVFTAARRRALKKAQAANRRKRGGRGRRRRNPSSARTTSRRAPTRRRRTATRARRLPVRRKRRPSTRRATTRRLTTRRRSPRRRNPGIGMGRMRPMRMLSRLIPGADMFGDLAYFGAGYYAGKAVHSTLVKDKPWATGTNFTQLIYDAVSTVTAMGVGSVAGMVMGRKAVNLSTAGALFYALQRGIAARVADNASAGSAIYDIFGPALDGPSFADYVPSDSEGVDDYLTTSGDAMPLDDYVLADYTSPDSQGIDDWVDTGSSFEPGADADPFEANFADAFAA